MLNHILWTESYEQVDFETQKQQEVEILIRALSIPPRIRSILQMISINDCCNAKILA